ncbi:uncharacterized protein LOC121591762 [Anopheles merus]|uniref:uncharacterized protein LOC121591762 n=1 Tax=Anopheles merus TaxID=30066 RepID=UPI001BE3F0FF|nr:uncharacterized protein LOC121591762 [Anopheles merus]
MGWPAFLNFRKNIRTHAAFVGVILILYAIFSILTGVAWWLELKVQTGSDEIDYEVKADAFSPKSKRSIDAWWSFNGKSLSDKPLSSKSKNKMVNAMFSLLEIDEIKEAMSKHSMSSLLDFNRIREAISHEINQGNQEINQQSTQYTIQGISQDIIQEINQEIYTEIMYIKVGSLIMSIVSSFTTIMYWIAYLKRHPLFLVIFIVLMTFAFVALFIGMFVMIQQQKFIWACAMLLGFLVNGYVLTVALQLHSNFKFTRRQHGYGTEVCVLPLK